MRPQLAAASPMRNVSLLTAPLDLIHPFSFSSPPTDKRPVSKRLVSDTDADHPPEVFERSVSLRAVGVGRTSGAKVSCVTVCRLGSWSTTPSPRRHRVFGSVPVAVDAVSRPCMQDKAA
jgi:hypothetical protein